jgi:hypothetical protein
MKRCFSLIPQVRRIQSRRFANTTQISEVLDDVFSKSFVGHGFGAESDQRPDMPIDLTFHGSRTEFLHSRSVIMRNPSAAKLYELGLKERGHPLYHSQTKITSTGALAARSGKCTGRIPKDKRVVEEDLTKDKVWWGPVNFPMSERDFAITRKRAVDFLNTRQFLYVVDGFANWDVKNRLKIRVICSTAYHALFMQYADTAICRRVERFWKT